MGGTFREVTTAIPNDQPLEQLLYRDDFDNGLSGWTGLIGNYEDSLDTILPGFADLRPPMLSNLTVWDTGTNGSLSGTYAMKLATRPRSGSMSVGIKRATFRELGLIRLEAYFAFKPEARALRLSDTDVRAVGVLFDLQHGDRSGGAERVMPHIRYLNARDGQPIGRWQYKKEREPLKEIGDSEQTRSHFHLADSGWLDIPDGEQRLCYNEIATKQNWHYLCVDFSLKDMAFVGFRCNDRTFDVSGIEPMRMPAMPNLWCMLNVAFWVEADGDRRSFLYVDSVTLSEQVR